MRIWLKTLRSNLDCFLIRLISPSSLITYLNSTNITSGPLISSGYGNKDSNGMWDGIYVIPYKGAPFCYTYERKSLPVDLNYGSYYNKNINNGN